jgi:cell wall-associated NlpC family hydrolase/outer membrane murein-binding lipoprotein Lpp
MSNAVTSFRPRARAAKEGSRPVERLPSGRHVARARTGRHKIRFARAATSLASFTAVAITSSLILLGGVGAAAPRTPPPKLSSILAQAKTLSRQVDALSQQYDGLRIQLAAARSQLRTSRLIVARDERLLARYESAVGQLAALGYMTGGLDPSLQLLAGTNPQAMLNRASIVSQLQQANGSKINLVRVARAAAERASLTAQQEAQRAVTLAAAMREKVAQIKAKVAVLNSQAFSQAMAIYRQTGKYPNVQVPGHSIGVQALRYALTKVGDPYVWGAAGPNAFDCSGLVVWSYAQIGISLPHYTGAQWNSGVHISRSQLQPGDLVFFFADLGHVGMYVGNGLMVDAPTYGVPVHVEPIFWSAYAGAVRIG